MCVRDRKKERPGHVEQKRVLDHKPALRPAETELMVAEAVEAMDPMTSRPLQNKPLPVREV